MVGVVIAGAIAAAAFAPAGLLATAVATALRRRALASTWTVAPAVASLAAVGVTGPEHFDRFTRASARGEIAGALEVATPLWLLSIAPLTLTLMLYFNRRDRLHGGAAEQRARAARGPIEVLTTRRATKREHAAGPHTENGTLLGKDDRGRPVRIPTLRAHATIVGGSNSGKTNTAEVLLEAQAASGGGFIVLDGKGGTDLPRLALTLGAKHGKPVALWSIRPYQDQQLDRHRLPWNPIGEGDPTEIKDRIATTEEQTEPYYAAVAARGLLAAARALHQESAQRLDHLAHTLEDPKTLARKLAPDDLQEAKWLDSLSEGERSALRGMATRLRTMASSDGAEALLPSAGDPQIRLQDAIERGHLVVFTLPQGLYPELVPHVTRYALQALNAVCARVEASPKKANAIVFVDELSAFDGEQLCAGFERGRSAGVRFVVATQSLSNLATAGGDKLLHAALDNAELLVIHRQAVPDAAELLAGVTGTEEAWEHTHLVDDASGIRIGWDEPGQRNRRLTDRFRAHPNVIKSLGQGEAIIVAQRPAFSVRRMRVRPGATAAHNQMS